MSSHACDQQQDVEDLRGAPRGFGTSVACMAQDKEIFRSFPERKLNVRQITKLSARFGLPADTFIGKDSVAD